ncbi:beta-galactosidase 9-like [Humulus lupulus]|uniref:beta-galactosidase 9-like n=1 Tax=Humulus lupulus TaxID=3486 RepID=UPI002B40BA4A|nr:beta-galactosidase 9-like [Humulus lupulus]XP_062099189.1 beta-galactosidase 9-like [Humulus lupulus]
MHAMDTTVTVIGQIPITNPRFGLKIGMDDGAGFRGQVKLTGFQNGDIDLSKSLWTYQVGLKGEFLKIYAAEENEKAGWTDLTPDADPSILTI